MGPSILRTMRIRLAWVPNRSIAAAMNPGICGARVEVRGRHAEAEKRHQFVCEKISRRRFQGNFTD